MASSFIDFDDTPDNNSGTATRSFNRGIDQSQAMLFGAANAIGELVGADFLAEWGEEGIQRNVQAMRDNPPEIRSWDDVESFETFGTYVLEALGEQSGQFAVDGAAFLAGGGTGGLAAKGITKAQFGKAIKRRIGEKRFQHGLKNLSKRTAQTAGIGAIAGQTIGETQLKFIDEGIEAPGDAIIAGTLKAGLETAGIAKILGLSRKLGRNPVQLIKEVGKAAGVESVTESTQTIVDFMAVKANDADYDVFSTENLKELRESAIKGGIVGGAFGGTAAIAGAFLAPPSNADEDDNKQSAFIPFTDETQFAQEDVAPQHPSSSPDNQEQIQPESQETIDAQAAAVVDPTSTKDTLHVTQGTPAPSIEIPDAEVVDDGIGGAIVTTDPAKAQLVREEGPTEQVIGQVLYGVENGKQDTDGTMLVARDAEGIPVSEVLTNADNFEADATTAEQHAPEGGTVEISDPQTVLEEREARRDNVTNLQRQQAEELANTYSEQIQVLQSIAESDSEVTDVARTLIDQGKRYQQELNLEEAPALALALDGFVDATREESEANVTEEQQEELQQQDNIIVANDSEEIATSTDNTNFRFKNQAEEHRDALLIANPAQRVTVTQEGRFNYTVNAEPMVSDSLDAIKRDRQAVQDKNPDKHIAIRKNEAGGYRLVPVQLSDALSGDYSTVDSRGNNASVTQRAQRGLADARRLAGQLTRAVTKDPTKNHQLARVADFTKDGKNIRLQLPAITAMGMDINKNLADGSKRTLPQSVYEGFLTGMAEVYDAGYTPVNDALLDINAGWFQGDLVIYAPALGTRGQITFEDALTEAEARTGVVSDIQSLERKQAETEVELDSTLDAAQSPHDPAIQELRDELSNLRQEVKALKKEAKQQPRGGIDGRTVTETETPEPGITDKPVTDDVPVADRGSPNAAEQATVENKASLERTANAQGFVNVTGDIPSKPDYAVMSFDEFDSRVGEDGRLENPVSYEDAEQAVNDVVESLGGQINIPIYLEERDARDIQFKDGTVDVPIRGTAARDGSYIIVFIPTHANKADVEETLRHEILAHFGLAKFFSESEKQSILDLIKDHKGSLTDQWAFVDQMYPDLSQDGKAEEVFALLAETLPDRRPPGIWRRIADVFLTALRRVGLIKDNEVRVKAEEFLHDIVRYYRTQRKGKTHFVVGYGDGTVNRVFVGRQIQALSSAIKTAYTKTIGDTVVGAVFSAKAQLKAVAPDIVPLIYQETQSAEGVNALWSRINRNAKYWNSQFNRIVRNNNQTALKEAFDGLVLELPTAELTPLGRQLRRFIFSYHNEYLSPRLPTLGFTKNYFPRLYDSFAIQNRRDEFMAILEKHKVENPESVFVNIIELQEPSIHENRSFMSLRTKILRQRQLKDPGLVADLVKAKFLNPNPIETLLSYIHSSTKRAEWEADFGGYQKITRYTSPQELQKLSAGQFRTRVERSNKTVLKHIALENDLYPDKPLLKEFRDITQALKDARNEGVLSATEIRDIEIARAEVADRAEQSDIADTLKSMREFGHMKEFEDGTLGIYNPNQTLRQFILEQGVDAKHFQKIKNLVMSAIQTQPIDRTSKAYNIAGEIRAYESLRVLAMSGIASIPELGAIYARLNQQMSAFEYGKIMANVAKDYKSSREFAEDIGAIQKGASVAMLQDMHGPGVGEESGKHAIFRRILPHMFRLNGNNAIVNYMLAVATEAGRVYLKRNAINATEGTGQIKARAERYLARLNVTAAQVLSWVDHGYRHPTELTSKAAVDARYAQDALNRFVDESVLQPIPPERPVGWPEHPIGSLVFNLKSYMYAFYEKVMMGMYRELKAGRATGDTSVMRSMGYLMAVGGVFMFFGGVSDELRQRILSLGEYGTYYRSYQKPDKMAYKWLDRSGLVALPFGDFIFDPSVDSAMFAAGPTFSHIQELLFKDPRGDKDALKRTLKSIPVTSQFYGIRRRIYEQLEAAGYYDNSPSPLKV